MSLRTTAKRTLALLVSLCLSVGLALTLVACGKSDEDAIRQQVAASLDTLSDTSEENVRTLLGEQGFNAIQAAGFDPVAVYSSLVGKFTYEITDVTIDQDVATVTLTVSNADVASVVSAYKTTVEEWARSDDATYTFDQEGQEGIEREVGRMLSEALASPDIPTKTAEVTLELRRGEDGVWVATDPSQVSRIVFAGADPSTFA